MPHDGVGPQQMAAFGPEEDDVRLHDVVLAEHDVERCEERVASGLARVGIEQQEDRPGGQLVTRQR